jgi:hypothetical protein
MGPFKVLAYPAPNTYSLDLPSSWRVFNEFNVDRLRPYVRRPSHLGGETGPPAPVVGADGTPEHEVAELLKFKMRYGRPHVLMRWTGRGDTWEPLDNLTNCEEAITAFERATGRTLPRPAPRLPLAAGTAPSSYPLQGSLSTPHRRRTLARRS